MKEQKWFESWFDSPYYHLLYSNRDEQEAADFISRLIQFLKPDASSYFLDLACGKGRHSIYLNKLGYRVDGLDYSENNINIANEHKSDDLQFYRHDMRVPLPRGGYNFILNLFTSFGYFDSDKEHQDCVGHIAKGLAPGGKFIIDFMNAERTIQQMIPFEVIERGGINFEIRKRIENKRIIKEITFKDKGRVHQYNEVVRAFSKEELSALLLNAGLTITDTFGDYDLNEFSIQNSERLILVAKK